MKPMLFGAFDVSEVVDSVEAFLEQTLLRKIKVILSDDPESYFGVYLLNYINAGELKILISAIRSPIDNHMERHMGLMEKTDHDLYLPELSEELVVDIICQYYGLTGKKYLLYDGKLLILYKDPELEN